MKLLNIHDSNDSKKCLTLKNVLEEANLPQADLSGYIALTDSILYIIMHSNHETEEVSIMIALLMCMEHPS